MNIKTLIEESIEDIDSKRKPLSNIIMKCIRIALHMEDIKSWLWLKLESISTVNKVQNERFAKQAEALFIEKGFSVEEFREFYQQLLEEYIRRRKYPKLNIKKNTTEDMINASSIGEIEASIESLIMKIRKNELPEGLHSLDLYFKNEEKQKIDLYLMTELDNCNKIINRTTDQVYEFLVEAERKVSMSTVQLKDIINNKNIFIIHGHDEAKWRELEKLLKDDFGLNPFILSEMPNKGMTIIEKFEYYASECCYAFAIFTPDDIIESNGIKYFQARPNVIFELGWFCSHLGRDRVCILYKDGNNSSIFSDFQGVIQKRFNNSINEVYRDIRLELNSVGIF